MTSPTLLVADYPIGFASGFGETLFNLFRGFESQSLWSASPGHNIPADGKQRGQSLALPSPSRPTFLPTSLFLAYHPFLKANQLLALRQSTRKLARFVEEHSIRNLLVVPVTPWILSLALSIHTQHQNINLVLMVMDDWQGHHESYGLPYSARRRRLLQDLIDRANTRFAVSREMAAHYESYYGKRWLVAHNGIDINDVCQVDQYKPRGTKILLAGDVNVFRYDAVLAFAQAIERHNSHSERPVEFSILGDVAFEYRARLSSVKGVKLRGRQTHAVCLSEMRKADLLYLPLAFFEKAKRISLYSLPTKLPEYLATGKPVLFHAPKESALFRVAERHDLNPRLSTVDSKTLDSFLAAWSDGTSTALSSFSNAKVALSKEFDLEQLSSTFQRAFL